MSELSDLLGESVQRLFGDHADAAAAAVRDGWQAALWQQTQELGLSLTLVPEDQGGVSGTWEDAYAVLQPAGFHQIPLPLAESMLAARLCSDSGLTLPEGLTTVSPYCEGALRAGGSDLLFSGVLRAVPWGRHSDAVLCVVDYQGGLQLVLLPRAAARIDEGLNLAHEPRDTLHFDACRPLSHAPAKTREAQQLLEYCALLRLPQIVGALESALARSIQYATERKQFGRAIGQFQAVQQQLALFGADVAAVACAVRAACRAAGAGDASFQIGAAKLRANQAIGLATASAHQVHAAIGFTWDHPLHHATQRLWSWRSEWGNDRFWSERLGAVVAVRGAENFWSDLTARDDASSGVGTGARA